MKPEKKHFVVFMSPGTLFSEESERPIEGWDTKAAVGLSETIKERYGATPYGFYFQTRLIAPPVPDGEGGTMNVQPKTVRTSGTHFFGKLETVEEIEARKDPRESILVSNMRGNDWPIVAVSTRGYSSVHPFGENDRLVGADGAILERGDDPKWVAYRKSQKRE